MKPKFIFCLTGLFFLFVMNVHSSVIGDLNVKGDITLSGNDIPFETEFSDGNEHRSITPDIPIFAMLFEGNLVEIEFIAAVGEVEITISQNGAPVYNSSENISIPVLKDIQLARGLTGTCLIEIKGNNGAYAYGWFNL